MNFKLNCGVMKVGNSLALALPVSLCENFGIKKGDRLDIIYTQQGLLIPHKIKKTKKASQFDMKVNKS